jgi:WD40 repeat protein
LRGLTPVPTAEEFDFGAFVVEAAVLGETAAFALGDGSVRLADGSAKKIDVHSGAILCATPTANGAALLTGGDDGRVAQVEADGAVSAVAEVPNKWIDQVAAGPNGAVAYSSGRQVAVRLGDGRERTLALDRAAGGLAFAPKGMRLAVPTYGGVILWWVATDADPIRLQWKGAHQTISFAPDGRFIVTAMQENALHAWRVTDGVDMHMSGYPAKTRSLAWSVKGRYLVTSGANAAVVWPFLGKDGPMGKEPAQVAERDVLVTRVACHPRDDRVAVGYRDGMVSVADLSGKDEAVLRRGGEAAITTLAFDRRGHRLAFGTEAGRAGVLAIGD